MQDRVSLYPGRVKLEPVAGQANLYDLTRADQPTQEGTPLNKATLLKDDTAEKYGLGDNALVDDAFKFLAPGKLATITVTTTLGATVTCTDGFLTLTKKADEVICVFHVKLGTWTIKARRGEEDGGEHTVVVSTLGDYAVFAPTVEKVYGVVWDGSSSTLLTRTDRAAGFTNPVAYMAGLSSYGSPFDNIMPWSGMTVVDDAEAGKLVKIPKFWYKLTQNGKSVEIRIADAPLYGFSVSPAHMDRGDGKGERDVVYVGRYHCRSSDYKSYGGSAPKNNITRSSARSGIHALGSTVWQSDFLMAFTIWLLYIVEYADWNSQAVIGYGCGNGSDVQSMGYTDSMPYHTGTTASARTTYGATTQYRNIEGLWDNCFDWMDGCYYNSNGMMVILNPSAFSDSSGGVLVGKPTNGWISALSVKTVSGLPPLFIPSGASGGNSTYVPDYWFYDASRPCLSRGGNYAQNRDRGMFYVEYSGVSSASASAGCRLMKLPDKEENAA